MRKVSPLVINGICAFIIVLAFFALLSYYFDLYTKQVDILIIVLTLALSVDCLFYIKHTKYKISYYILASLFFLVSLTHILRFIYGPIHCDLFNELISIYLYDIIAIFVGLLLTILSFYLIKRKSGEKYHHLAGILVGCAMIINHIFKIFIGMCI